MRTLLKREQTTAYDMVKTVHSVVGNMKYDLMGLAYQPRRLCMGTYDATSIVDCDQVSYQGKQYSVHMSSNSATICGEYISYTIEGGPTHRGYDASMELLHAVEDAVAEYLHSCKHNFPVVLLRQIQNIIYELDYPMKTLFMNQFHGMGPEQCGDILDNLDCLDSLSKHIARSTVRKIKAAVKWWWHRMPEVGRMLHKSVGKAIRREKRKKRKK